MHTKLYVSTLSKRERREELEWQKLARKFARKSLPLVVRRLKAGYTSEQIERELGLTHTFVWCARLIYGYSKKANVDLVETWNRVYPRGV